MRNLVRFLLIIVVIVGTAAPGLAVDKVYDVSTAAIVAPVTSYGTEGVLESWGFEPGEGFVPGFIGGQVGWSGFAASTAEGHIDTVNPRNGTQHLRISLDPAVASGNLLGAFSPVVPDLVVDASSVLVYVAIGATGGADYDVVPQTPTQGFLTARVKFSWQGDILVLDDTGSGLGFVDTGTDYTPGPYVPLQIDIDPVGNTIDYFYNGVLIYSSVAGVFAGTIVEQVVLLSDNFNLSESGDFDDLSIDRGVVPVELQSISID